MVMGSHHGNFLDKGGVITTSPIATKTAKLGGSVLVVGECEVHGWERLTSYPGVPVCEKIGYEVVCLVVLGIIWGYRASVSKTIPHIEDTR